MLVFFHIYDLVFLLLLMKLDVRQILVKERLQFLQSDCLIRHLFFQKKQLHLFFFAVSPFVLNLADCCVQVLFLCLEITLFDLNGLILFLKVSPHGLDSHSLLSYVVERPLSYRCIKCHSLRISRGEYIMSILEIVFECHRVRI